MDPHNDKALASKEALEYWGQVDWYNGGMEHTTLHLLYSRFWPVQSLWCILMHQRPHLLFGDLLGGVVQQRCQRRLRCV